MNMAPHLSSCAPILVFVRFELHAGSAKVVAIPRGQGLGPALNGNTPRGSGGAARLLEVCQVPYMAHFYSIFTRENLEV